MVTHLIRLGAVLASAGALAAQPFGDPRKSAPYVPSPDAVVRQMLEAGGLRPGETHFDLGSGDGRLVVAAARDFGAVSVGYEIDAALVAQSRETIRRLGLGDRARIENGDLFEADFGRADLITTYLLPVMLRELRPLLEKRMKPGARLVSHDYPIDGWTPTRIVSGENADNGLPYQIYVYVR